MAKLYQIYEDDLAELERIMPRLVFLCGESMNNTADRMKARRVKEILSNVRWNYGPPDHVEIHPADEEPSNG